MKKMLFIAASFLLTLASCSKADDNQKDDASPNSNYFVSFVVDGKEGKDIWLSDPKDIRKSRFSETKVPPSYNTNTDIHYYNIYFAIDLDGKPAYIHSNFIIQAGKPIEKKEYSYDGSTPHHIRPFRDLMFSITGVAIGDVSSDGKSSFKMKITELTDSHIAGTFEGVFKEVRTSTGKKDFVITQGKFSLPFTKK